MQQNGEVPNAIHGGGYSVVLVHRKGIAVMMKMVTIKNISPLYEHCLYRQKRQRVTAM